MKKVIAIDMDGVMADIYGKLLAYEENKTGRKIDVNSLVGITESKAFSTYRECLEQDGFFETAPVMEGAVETLEYLNSKYRVLIVSAAAEYPKSMMEKNKWLTKYFPFLSWKQFVFCGVKDFIKADIMIDDHLRHLNAFQGDMKILYAQPHNVNDVYNDIIRADWRQIREIL